MLDCQKAALDLVRAVRDPWRRIRAERASLADQLVRAAESTLLNVAEGARLKRKSAAHSFTIASGSNAEVAAALSGAEALGLVTADEIAAALELCDRIGGMLHKLIHR